MAKYGMKRTASRLDTKRNEARANSSAGTLRLEKAKYATVTAIGVLAEVPQASRKILQSRTRKRSG